MNDELQAAGSPEELAAVSHLLELGYHDPLDVARRAAIDRRQRQAELDALTRQLALGDPGDAADRLERIAQACPDWAVPRRLLAQALFRLRQYEAARRELFWFEARGIEHAELALLRAAVDLAQRRLDDAREQAEYAKRLREPLPAADALLGEVAFRRGQLDDAEAAYRRALAAEPGRADALAGLAAIALRRGAFEAAANWSLESLERQMTAPRVHLRLGMALIGMGRWTEAAAAFDTAARLAPNLTAPWRLQAALARRQDDPASADRCIERARQIVRSR